MLLLMWHLVYGVRTPSYQLLVVATNIILCSVDRCMDGWHQFNKHRAKGIWIRA